MRRLVLILLTHIIVFIQPYLCKYRLPEFNIIIGLGMISGYNDFNTTSKLLIKQNL